VWEWTCGWVGTKFNSRKEDAEGENYLGIQIFRFYFRCSKCSAEITMKTDPQNSDYTVEHGASRNYEPWRDKDAQVLPVLPHYVLTSLCCGGFSNMGLTVAIPGCIR
jgi:hypothetical protein